MQYSINVHKQLLDLSLPRIMAIVNITPDSFYTSWSGLSENTLLDAIQNMLHEGADMIDIGACSTRPNSVPVDADAEWARLSPALQAIRYHFPSAILSVDTFRAEIAEKALEAGADMINDVFGGGESERIWEVVAAHRVPYILTHAQALSVPSHPTDYDYTMSQVVDFMQSSINRLHKMGVADVIIDPGFGFNKTEQQNYTILRDMDILHSLHVPILVGISRKSMLYNPLGLTPADVLPATIAAHTIALDRGAKILRVHDVAAAKQAITVYSLTQQQTPK
jgi:dihydropteroate synthase